MVRYMSIKKIQWIDLSIFVLSFLVILLNGLIIPNLSIIPLELSFSIYAFFGFYFLIREIHILKTKTAFTWLSFSCFIAYTIFSFIPVYMVLVLCLIPFITYGPIGIGFYRLYFMYEFSTIFSLAMVVLTIVCCTKVIKYQKIDDEKVISLKKWTLSEKITTIIDVVLLIGIYNVVLYVNIYFFQLDMEMILSILIGVLSLMIIKNIVVLILRKNTFNSIEFTLNITFIILILYSIETVVPSNERLNIMVSNPLSSLIHTFAYSLCWATLFVVLLCFVINLIKVIKNKKSI